MGLFHYDNPLNLGINRVDATKWNEVVTAIENAYGTYVISTDGTTIEAKNLSTGIIDYSDTDAATVFNDVFTALTNGGLVLVNRGTYTFTSDVTASAKGIELIGAGFDNTRSSSVTATRFVMTNAKLTLAGRSSYIHNIFLDGSSASNTQTDILVITGQQARIGSLFVWSHKNGCNGVRFTGASGSANYLNNCKVDHLIIQGGGGSSTTAALYLQYTTQSEFSSIFSTGAQSNAVIWDNSDNNHHSRLQVSSMVAGAKGLVFGTDSASKSYLNVIDYLDIAHGSGYTTIEQNYAGSVAAGEGANTILHATLEIGNSDLSFVHNNSSYGMVNITTTQRRPLDFNITTPSLPGGTGSGNYVQNTNPFIIHVYQTGMVGTHLITKNGTDTTLGVDSNLVILRPGDKIYYATTIPSAWKWRGA